MMHCQRCRLPVRTHQTLARLTANQRNLFHDSATPKTPVGANADASFIVLTETLNPLGRAGHFDGSTPRSPGSGSGSATTISEETEAVERLFHYVSSRSDLDLPLCQECADAVRQALKAEYRERCDERDAFITLLNKVKDEPAAAGGEAEALQARISALESQVSAALGELETAEQELAAATAEQRRAEQRRRGFAQAHAGAFAARNAQELAVTERDVETRRLEALAEYQQSQLRRLQATSVYNDVFCIRSENRFGTINGLRLGRLNDEKVEWSEINAAWGQCLLMLSTLLAKFHIKVPEYRLRPLGSMSRIDRLELHPETGDVVRSTSLDLYSSDYSFERFLYPKRMDAAMAAFLDILKRVGEHVESSDRALRLPYAIEGDRIGNVRLSLSSSNESWTAACRYVLTNLRWLVTND